MKIELFTFCDGAYNYDGRLTIVGTYDDIKAQSFPWKTNMSFALKLLVSNDEAGKKALNIKFTNAAGEPFAGEINTEIDIPQSDSVGHIAIASMMQGIVFNSEGKYNVCILENGHELKTFTFNVLK